MAVPGERPEPADGNVARSATSGLPLVAANAEMLTWLDVLLKGKPEQQAVARTEIAMMLEAQGFTHDAEEAYWTNVQARATDRRAYERLIGIYQLRRDRLSETLVRRQFDLVFGTPESDPLTAADAPSPAPLSPADTASQSQTPDRTIPATSQSSTQVSAVGSRSTSRRAGAWPPRPQDAEWPTIPRLRRLRGSRRPAPENGAADGQTRTGAGEQSPASRSHQLSPRRRPSEPGAGTPPGTTPGRAPGLEPAVAPSAAARLSDHPPVGRRAAPLSPSPTPAVRRGRLTTGGLIVLEPTTIGTFLLASVGAAMLIAFLLIASQRGGTRSAAHPDSQLPTRCADASLRFPGLTDPRAAVVGAYRDQGVNVEAQRPGGARLTADQAEQVVGGWMGFSLLMEHAGQPSPTLAEWLDSETDRPTLANAMVSGRRVDAMLTPDEWTVMRAWPAMDCEGAFMHDPRNAGLVRLIERVVSRQ